MPRARLRAAPGRNVAMMLAAEQRLTERLASFFATAAQHVSRQISQHLGHEPALALDVERDRANGAKNGSHEETPDDKHLLEKGSDHPDLHVKPENAIPIDLPVADVVTFANVQHVSWELVREGKTRAHQRTVSVDELVATQKVVDRERIAKHIEQLRETGKLDEKWPPLVLEWDNDFFILSGHHGTVAAKKLGWKEVPVDVMSAD